MTRKKKKTFHARVRDSYEVIETGGMAPTNAPPPPEAVPRPSDPSAFVRDLITATRPRRTGT